MPDLGNMARFIVRFRGAGSPPAADVSRIRSVPELRVVDSSARMLLVDAVEHHLRAAIDDMPDWLMAPEQIVPLPDSRKKVLNPPHED